MKSTSKRVIYSILIVLLWMGFLVDGAHAVFTDSVTLTGNTISTGTADLLISNSQNPSSTTYDDTRPGFTFNLIPGETQDKYFLLKNASSSNVPFGISVVASSFTGTNSLRSNTYLEFTPVDETGTSVGSSVASTLADLFNPPTMQTLGTISRGATQRYRLRITLNPSYAEQNQLLGFDLVFNGNQNFPQ